MPPIEHDKKVCTLYFEPPLQRGAFTISFYMGYPHYEWLRTSLWQERFVTTRHDLRYIVNVVGRIEYHPPKDGLIQLCNDLLEPSSPNWKGFSIRVCDEFTVYDETISPFYDPRHEHNLFPPHLTLTERLMYR